ncbi:MAG TPA: ATP-binding protein [Anaerolineales bacterium]|nr:ATP-binding protein [Anaerolineales bacterium]
MARRTKSIWFSLPTQGVILIVVIVILTSSAIGVPAIWLISEQLDRQAWEQVNQGNRMVKVLLDAKSDELSNLAIVTAQRPTLIQLLELNDADMLRAYLETLRTGAGLDLMMLCGPQREPTVQAGMKISAQACQTGASNGVFQAAVGTGTSGWLLASQPILNEPTISVVAGQALDGDFSSKLREQTGLEHLLVFNGALIGGSFADNNLAWTAVTTQGSKGANVADNQPISERVSVEGSTYFAIRSRYGDTGLETIMLLPGTAIAEAQRELSQTAAGGILLVAALCSAVAILLARRVSLPLERLRDSAIALRRGDLTTPVSTKTKVNEIAEVTYALEDARVALRHTLEELRQEKAWVDHLLESVVEGIITLSRQGRITYFSQGAERITGWRQEQVLGKDIDEVFRLTERDKRFSQRIPAPGAKQEILTILVKGQPVSVSITGARLAPPEAGKADLVLFVRDISHEEAMRGLLGDFLANVTHEFRTPLTALAVSIELLLDQLPDLNRDELRELLVSYHLGVLSLQHLIDNLLEGASIEAGRFQVSPRPTELAEVIHEAIRVMQPLMEKNRQEMQLDLPEDLPLVRADPRRTGQVLVNLLSNAIKWGPQGSKISLRAIATDHEVKILVGDEGPGVSAEHKQDLFIRFARLESNGGRAEHGAGLGLPVVKAIVESQQGQVGVEDGPGGGAVFWFTIPIVHLYSLAEEDEL